MKKIFIISVLFFVFSSCLKKYSCNCRYYDEQGSTALTHDVEIGYYKNHEKDEAKAKCVEKNFPPNELGGNGQECTLKP